MGWEGRRRKAHGSGRKVKGWEGKQDKGERRRAKGESIVGREERSNIL
jgi:hypothetical protein